MLHGKRVPYTTYLGNFLLPTTLFHHPILSAPLQATPTDFPIGVQLHGKPGQDWQLLADCTQLEPFFAKSQPPAPSMPAPVK
jgi:Asp-tRNA(Asn)/Glu-tRNA(Gln) amidotransferase A subunit family amidase